MYNLFCGSSDIYPNSEFVPKSIPWDSNQLIGSLGMADIELSKNVITNSRETLWHNMVSEYDAENFCLYLDNDDFGLSKDFKAFEFIWRRDEYNHYLGFRHIYSVIYDVDQDDIARQLNNRTIHFDPIRDMLSDEFKICLLLAYDEIATTKSYSEDYEFYKSFGHENFLKWIKLVTRDEAYHFNNCMTLIGKNHPDRIPEIPKLVDLFIEWDLNRNEYQGTFVLDHENYSRDFLISCGDIMKIFFKR